MSTTTPTTLHYAEVVTVDLSDNAINFADAELDGHRVQVSMAKEDFNLYFRWYREVGQDRPVGIITDIPNLKLCLETSFSDGFTDLDSMATGLSFSTGSILNSENVSGSMNDIVMAYVLFKVYGKTSFDTSNKVYNATDALNMVTNNEVSVAIGDSITANNSRTQAVDQMFRDLLASDPARFFDVSGIQLPGLFEINTDASGNGSWQIAENDIVQIILNFVFHAQVSRRVVSAQEQPLLADGGLNGEKVTEEVIIHSGDSFKVRLQVKATAERSAARIAQLGGGGPIVPTIVDNVVVGYTGSDLTDVILPEGVILNSFAFYNCVGLRSIILPSSVEYIPQGCFSGCTGLTNFTIPPSVTMIDMSAFSGCSGLKTIIIPSTVTDLRGGVFFECTGLSSVTIPSSITLINTNTFNGCSSLISITMASSNTTFSSDVFTGVPNTSILSYPGPQSTAFEGQVIAAGFSGTFNVL